MWRCHLKLWERTNKRKQVTELYANLYDITSLVFTIHMVSPLIALSPEHIKASKSDMAKHVHYPCLLFSRNNTKSRAPKNPNRKENAVRVC